MQTAADTMHVTGKSSSSNEITTPLRVSLRNALAGWWRRDRLVLLFYALATVVMTFPVAFRLGGHWLATPDSDTYPHLWNVWWLRHLLRTGQRPYFTQTEFHPIGLDLTFESFSWTHAALSGLLQHLVSDFTAQNITILVAAFGTAYGGYLLMRSLVTHREAAWLGGAVYAFAPYHVAHLGAHPDLTHLGFIPITLLLLTTALTRPDLRAALGAALALGVTAFASLYILDLGAITAALLFVYLALDDRRWRQRRFWLATAVFAAASVIVAGLRIAPLLRDLNAFSAAIEGKYEASTLQTDLLSYVIPSHFNPLFEPLVSQVAARFEMNRKWPAYLGLVPLALTLSALTWKQHRARIWTWFAIALVFVLLSLGPVLRFNGRLYETVTLPARYVAWLPPIRAVARPDYFVLGVLLALGVCAAFGLERWLVTAGSRNRLRTAMVVTLSGLLLFEYWNGPFPGVTRRALVSPFYEQLAHEQGNFALIQLPMGRSPSKYYLYFQTIHERPIVEGLSSRLPADANRYIDDNLMLNLWWYRTPLDCSRLSAEDIQSELDRLAADGFRYVIVHHSTFIEPSGTNSAYFEQVPITYEDSLLTAYTLDDLRAHPPCPSSEN